MVKILCVIVLGFSIFGGGIATSIQQISYEKLTLSDLALKKAYPIKPPVKSFTKYLFLDLYRCQGVMDAHTFIKLNDLQTIAITDCQINPLGFEAFSKLEHLEKIDFINSRIFVDQTKPINRKKVLLTHFNELSFRNSFVSGLNRNALLDFSCLTKLEFINSQVYSTPTDMFYDLGSITSLIIRSTELLDFDFSHIIKLKSLKQLTLYDLRTNVKINYNLFRFLPNLETILFDASVYRDLDLDAFPKLRRCEIGLRDRKEEIDSEFEVIVTKLDELKKRRNIEYLTVCPDK